jgi:hypothetical protein
MKQLILPTSVSYPSINPNINNQTPLVLYSGGINLYSDRNYYDSIADPRLESSYLIQIPRHFKSPLQIEINRPVKIYRFITDANHNSIFHDWEPTNIIVDVQGDSCIFTAVVAKIFNGGKVRLPSGGPIAAAPILIQDLSQRSLDIPFALSIRNSI